MKIKNDPSIYKRMLSILMIIYVIIAIPFVLLYFVYDWVKLTLTKMVKKLTEV